MFRKSTIIALAATVSLGVAMASASTASAKPNFPNNGKIAMPKPHKIPGPYFKPNWPHKHPHWHVHYRYPRIWVAPRPVVYGAVAPVVSTPSRCTCLTKEYTPDGAVLFKDVCTNEAAINPPAQPAPTAQVQPQQ